MPYVLRLDESLASGLRRVAGEQANRAIRSLEVRHQPVEEGWDDAIHDLRKRCKKIRAVARLCRDALGGDYAGINAAFRDTAAILAQARNAASLVGSVGLLRHDDIADLVGADSVEMASEAFLRHYHRIMDQTSQGRVLHLAHHSLSAATAAITVWPLPPDLTARDLCPSILRVYRRGHEWLPQLTDTLHHDPQTHLSQWHDLRKRVKYLRYHLRLLQPAWPEQFDLMQAELHDLSDLLGQDHDQGEMVQTLRREPWLSPGMTEQIVGAAAVRRRQLRRTALELSARLFVEPPEAFAERIIGLVRVARG